MVLVYFIRVFFLWNLVFEVEIRIRSPCFKCVCFVLTLLDLFS